MATRPYMETEKDWLDKLLNGEDTTEERGDSDND